MRRLKVVTYPRSHSFLVLEPVLLTVAHHLFMMDFGQCAYFSTVFHMIYFVIMIYVSFQKYMLHLDL